MLFTAIAVLSLQTVLDRAMAGKSGAAVVLDAADGAVLARYGPQDRAALPGSAIKPFTLWALLEKGQTPVFPCGRRLEIRGRKLDCTHPVPPAPLDAVSALAYSCNSWFSQAAARLEPRSFAARLRQFGFSRAREAASPEELRLQALGSAAVEATPLELAAAYRRLALARANRQLAPVFEGLEESVNTGMALGAKSPSVAIAGKTGTTTHAWFAGFAPAREPKLVVAIFLERGRGSDAAPMARRIFEQKGDRRIFPVPGKMRLSPFCIRLRTGETVSLPLETYVAGVLAGEAATFRSAESLKAMAVTARTYAVRERGRHQSEGFDFCDTTHCQNFQPGDVPERLRQAIEATESELLWFEGRPAHAFYHRDCGGMTEAVADVWPDLRAPYLRRQEDPFCIARGRQNWHAEIPAGREIRILRRSPSGRVVELQAGGERLSGDLFSLRIGRTLGWQLLRSTLYDLHRAGSQWVFEGYGAGHGVGLCQAGTALRGEKGQNYREILAFYYPGTKLGVSAKGFPWTRMGGERVDVFSTRPDSDRALVPLADRMLREAERRTGFSTSARPSVRMYPSVAAFRDATGEPGWVAGSTLRSTVRLQPGSERPDVLLHEILHVLIEERAHPSLPAWFREGLALELSGSPAHSPGYARAKARVASLIAKHGRDAVLSWVERPPGGAFHLGQQQPDGGPR